jgi:hypothetical protein
MQNRRKTLLLNPKFQLTLMGFFFGLALFTLMLFYVALYYFFTKFHAMGVEVQLPNNHIFFQFIQKQKTEMNLIFGVVALVQLLGIVLGGLILSHKIAGPIHHLCTYLDGLLKGGKGSQLHFRDGDFFKEVPEKLNSVLKEKNIVE